MWPFKRRIEEGNDEVVKELTPLDKAWNQLVEASGGYQITVAVKGYVFKVNPNDDGIIIAKDSELNIKNSAARWYSPYRYVKPMNVDDYCLFVENYDFILDSVRSQAQEERDRVNLRKKRQEECRVKLTEKLERCDAKLQEKVGE